MSSVHDLPDRSDVLVVGARCAGAATAMLLARRGISVLAIDRAPYGADTTSTHAIMRGGIERLHAWGLLPRVERLTPKIRKTTFRYGDREAEVAIKPRDGVDALFAPRRSHLDALLVDAARETGANVRHGIRFTGVSRGHDGRVVGAHVADASGTERTIGCSMLVGADGLRSSVAGAVSARTRMRGRHATALFYGYFADLPVDGNLWFYEQRVAAGFIPTSGGLTNVFVATPPSSGRGFLGPLSEAAPDLATRVRNARPEGRMHSFPGVPALLREAVGPGWALVGDAGAYRDPITAHGMSDAFRDAELLARAVAEGTSAALEGYARERDEYCVEVMELSDAVASFAWRLDELEGIHRRLAEAMAKARLRTSEPQNFNSAETLKTGSAMA